MKRYIIAAVATLLSLTTFAQEVEQPPRVVDFGVKYGVTLNSQHFITNVEALTSTFNGIKPGIEAGATMRVNMIQKKGFAFLLQVETLLSADYYTSADNWALVGSANFPVLLGGSYKFSNGLKVKANGGPVFNANLGSYFKSAYEGYAARVEDLVHREYLTWAAGVGVDTKKNTYEIRYNWTKRTKSANYITDHMHHTNIAVSMGWIF